jgi:methyltransferase (TIGR00027 family)
MSAARPSSTAVLIARSIVLADATPELRLLVLPESAEWCGRFLAEAERAWWFDLALRHHWARSAIFALERLLLPGIIAHYLARKLLLDSFAREALANGARQVVVLGAGLDTLAWRLTGIECFELDHPDTQALKNRVGGERSPTLIATDLLHDSPIAALRAQPAFDERQATLFIAEGLFLYLPPYRVTELFRDRATLPAPGNRLAFTFMEVRPGQRLGFHEERRVIDWWLRWRGEPYRWGLAPEDLPAFATEQGWQVVTRCSSEDLRRRFLVPHGLESALLAAGESVALLELSARRPADSLAR